MCSKCLCYFITDDMCKYLAHLKNKNKVREHLSNGKIKGTHALYVKYFINHVMIFSTSLIFG